MIRRVSAVLVLAALCSFFCGCEVPYLGPFFNAPSLELRGIVDGQSLSTRESLTVTCIGTVRYKDFKLNRIEMEVDYAVKAKHSCGGATSCTATYSINGRELSVGEHDFRATLYSSHPEYAAEFPTSVKVWFQVYEAPKSKSKSKEHEEEDHHHDDDYDY